LEVVMRVAVVGGGLFGCTAAIYAARAGHDVHLFEVKPELMRGATAGTYSRLHRGYHYPRSPATGRESRRAEKLFRGEYGPAVIDSGDQIYVVPSRRSHVTVDQFRDFLDNEGLPFSEDGGVFQVTEPRINLAVLQQMVRQKVQAAHVHVHLNACVRQYDSFDRVVVATYATLNQVLGELGLPAQEYKFQVVERPVVQLPEAFRNTSIVVVDGPFGCIDPLDETPLHVLGHVTKTIHWENTGTKAFVPEHLEPLIDAGLINRPPVTNVWEVVHHLARYVPGVGDAGYEGSSYVVRAVLAHQEATDRRPTLVTRHNERVISVFSGKLGTAVRAAQEVLEAIEAREMVAA
jgi:glycine/D-amino acid oxidase-like deaminating enzyme